MVNDTRPIANISDGHLEMLTRIRVRAALRVDTRQQILEEAHFIMEIFEHIMGYMVSVGMLLQEMEQRMQDLLAEIGGLAIEEQ